MKKLISLLCVVLTVAFTLISCGNDSIVGKWQCVEEEGMIVEFKSDGTAVLYEGDDEYEYAWELKGNTVYSEGRETDFRYENGKLEAVEENYTFRRI